MSGATKKKSLKKPFLKRHTESTILVWLIFTIIRGRSNKLRENSALRSHFKFHMTLGIFNMSTPTKKKSLKKTRGRLPFCSEACHFAHSKGPFTGVLHMEILSACYPSQITNLKTRCANAQLPELYVFIIVCAWMRYANVCALCLASILLPPSRKSVAISPQTDSAILLFSDDP